MVAPSGDCLTLLLVNLIFALRDPDIERAGDGFLEVAKYPVVLVSTSRLGLVPRRRSAAAFACQGAVNQIVAATVPCPCSSQPGFRSG